MKVVISLRNVLLLFSVFGLAACGNFNEIAGTKAVSVSAASQVAATETSLVPSADLTNSASLHPCDHMSLGLNDMNAALGELNLETANIPNAKATVTSLIQQASTQAQTSLNVGNCASSSSTNNQPNVNYTSSNCPHLGNALGWLADAEITIANRQAFDYQGDAAAAENLALQAFSSLQGTMNNIGCNIGF